MKLAIRKEIINTLFLIHSSLLKPFTGSLKRMNSYCEVFYKAFPSNLKFLIMISIECEELCSWGYFSGFYLLFIVSEDGGNVDRTQVFLNKEKVMKVRRV